VQIPILEPPLALPVIRSGQVLSKVMQDLTVYVAGPSVEELEYLIDLYQSICPSHARVKYKIAELDYWAPLSRPVLTASGRAAAAAGVREPYLEPVRRRIREGRAFELQFWDGRSIKDPEGSWSFNCRRILKRATGLHAFVRILMPAAAASEILRRAATGITNNVELYSGHGGLAFVYNPELKEDAFDAIYAQARRFWGVDVEDLNDTLPLMKNSIKGVNWITLLGRRLASDDASAIAVESSLERLAVAHGVIVEQLRHGSVVIAGPKPVTGDQHRVGNELDNYVKVANALKPLFLDQHPDFPSERFLKNGNTLGWIRRFLEPAGWR
jgi:hypothetical protein